MLGTCKSTAVTPITRVSPRANAETTTAALEELKVIPVTVVVRSRPLVRRETNGGAKIVVQFSKAQNQVSLPDVNKCFTYDHVFPPDSKQDEVYEICAQKLIQTISKGYNATILAYGQTGSGKTFTMGTAHSKTTCTDNQKGIIPRVVADIFKLTALKTETHICTIRVSFLEIYNENVFDLLNPSGVKDVHIREDFTGIKISGVKEFPVECEKDVLTLLERGTGNRKTGSTNMNESSSRSHAIFTLTMEQRSKADTDDCRTSKFHLVDLAGSESAKKTGASGTRFREGVNINKALLALGNVISALCDRKSHIPYRDSKLTRLLQDSLGGNSFTVMVACISPSDSNLEETLNTLRYADRAKKIQNKPIVNKDQRVLEIEELKKQSELVLTSGGGDQESDTKRLEASVAISKELQSVEVNIQEKQILLCHYQNDNEQREENASVERLQCEINRLESKRILELSGEPSTSKNAGAKMSEERQKSIKALEGEMAVLKKEMAEKTRLLSMKREQGRKKELEKEIMESERIEERKEQTQDVRFQNEQRKMLKNNEGMAQVTMNLKAAQSAKQKLEMSMAKQTALAKDGATFRGANLSERVKDWLNQEINVEFNRVAARKHIEVLKENRAKLDKELENLQEQLEDLSQSPSKKRISCDNIFNLDEVDSSDTLEKRLEIEQEISRIMQSIEKFTSSIQAFHHDMLTGSDDLTLNEKSRWNELSKAAEFKCALSYLFEMLLQQMCKNNDVARDYHEARSSLEQIRKEHRDCDREMKKTAQESRETINKLTDEYNVQIMDLLDEVSRVKKSNESSCKCGKGREDIVTLTPSPQPVRDLDESSDIIILDHDEDDDSIIPLLEKKPAQKKRTYWTAHLLDELEEGNKMRAYLHEQVQHQSALLREKCEEIEKVRKELTAQVRESQIKDSEIEDLQTQLDNVVTLLRKENENKDDSIKSLTSKVNDLQHELKVKTCDLATKTNELEETKTLIEQARLIFT